ncbi:EI24 domain-containing protein [Tateyamaria armeniaca]|uniref:EI24 domain-containing protein n=1 Tax=Tateyamaria armeniaca TaxID=2518930 RepID=A0ABW8UPA9_9RHOB
MILSSFFSALGQIGDARFRRVLLLGLALTIALLIGATSGFVWLIGSLTSDSMNVPWVGEITWLDDVISWGSFFLFFVLSIFLMMPVASAITSMFLEEVAAAVEDRHYPNLPPAIKVSFGDALVDTVNFLGVLIGANIPALILYVMFPPSAIFIFWGLNGFLLGREYFTLAAMRRVGRTQAKELRSAHSGTIWLAGTLMAIPLSIPLVNLLIPIIGAATFTHLYHKITKA